MVTKALGLFLATITVVLNCSSIISARTVNMEENSLLKALMSLKNPETNQRLFTETLSASENTPNALTRQNGRGMSLHPVESETSMEVHRSGRTKRTIGFLTRLGACVLTFMSNPTCWQRLTRAQIEQEKSRQQELQQQEQQRRFLEHKIYQGYINTLLGQSNGSNGTDGNGTDTSGNSGTSITLPLISLPTMSMYTSTTPKPRLFPLGRRLLSTLFPRLFSFMNPNSPSPTSYYSSNGLTSNNFLTRNDPQYQNLF